MSIQEAAKGANNKAAIIFAVFAAVCMVAFLAYRGSDVVQLPQLIGNLGGGPLFGRGISDSLAGVAVAVLIGISWFGLGSFVTRLVKGWVIASRLLEIAVSTAIGAAIWSLIWFFLGLVAIPPSPYGRGQGAGTGFLSFISMYSRVFGLYSGPVAVAAVVIGVALAGLSLVRVFQGTVEDNERAKPFDRFVQLMIAIPVTLAFVAALAPPIAKDTLLYHFAVPKAFIAQGGNAFIDGNIASYLSLGTEMHAVWAMLLGGLFSSRAAETGAGATTFLFFPLLLMVIYGWAREIGVSRRWSLVATLMVAAVPTAFYVGSSGYIDLSLALFVTLAVYALCRWWREPAWNSVILIGIFLGAALSIKLTTVFVIAAFALAVLLRAREAKPPVTTVPGSDTASRVLLTGFGALLLACVIASPWYMRTWAATGSPVFPFYMSIWPGKAEGWDAERSDLFQAMNSQYGGGDESRLNYLTAPVRVSIAAQPEQAANYDGVLGVGFLLGLPILVWALWKFDVPVEAKIAAGVAGIIYLFWLFSSQQLRYLLPILPSLGVAIAASVEAISGHRDVLNKVWKYSITAASLAAVLTSVAWLCHRAPLRVVLGGETRDQYLTRNLDYYPYYQAVNTDTPPDSKIWLINMRRDTYNIERPVFSDYLFEDWTLRKMLWDSRSVQELKAKTAAMGIKYVLTRHDFLFDYDKSSLVDDKKTRAENEAKLKIAKDFILDPANIIKSDGKFSLIKVL